MIESIRKARNFLQRNWRELWYFWRYAVLAKLHFWPYRSRKAILLRLDLIGDCTMFTSAARAIREFYKDREMTVVCLSISRPVFERLGIFDKIICVDFRPNNIEYDKIGALISELRSEAYDLLLQPQVSRLPVADILGAAIRCNRRVAIRAKPGNSKPRWIKMVDFLYDEQFPYPEGVVSEFDYYGAFVRGLGNPGYRTVCPCLPYGEQHFIEGDYYVLYPGGSLGQKFWPADRFAKIADHIFARTGLVGVILGVASEQWVSDRLKERLAPVTGMSMIDLTGRTSISDVIDIIGNAKLVVSNDTSGVHIACATNTPSVVDVGGWHFQRFFPYHIEDVKPENHLPLAAYTELPCYYCDWDWDIIAERNPECLEHLKAGESSSCISAITAEQMLELVDRVIDAEELD